MKVWKRTSLIFKIGTKASGLLEESYHLVQACKNCVKFRLCDEIALRACYFVFTASTVAYIVDGINLQPGYFVHQRTIFRGLDVGTVPNGFTNI